MPVRWTSEEYLLALRDAKFGPTITPIVTCSGTTPLERSAYDMRMLPLTVNGLSWVDQARRHDAPALSRTGVGGGTRGPVPVASVWGLGQQPSSTPRWGDRR